jgi:hypothetical protein
MTTSTGEPIACASFAARSGSPRSSCPPATAAAHTSPSSTTCRARSATSRRRRSSASPRSTAPVLESCPILLGALFKEIGTADIPLFQMNAPRQRWFCKDMTDWANAWGVPFRFPSVFPIRSVDACRAMLVEPRDGAAIYRAAWADDRNVSDRESCARSRRRGLRRRRDPRAHAGAGHQGPAAREHDACDRSRCLRGAIVPDRRRPLLGTGPARPGRQALDGWRPSVDQNGSFPRAAYSSR